MSVSNGQIANAATFNNAFLSKFTDSTTTAVIGLNNTSNPDSGPQIFNIQRYTNEVADSDGTVGEGDVTRKTYSSNNVVANGDNRKVAIGKLDAAFDLVSGHDHDGVNSKKVSAADLVDINYYKAVLQTVTFDGAVGTDDDVSAEFSGKTPGGDVMVAGVPTTAPWNRVELRTKSNEEQIEDANGQKVYGRLTEAAGVWTITYYTNEAGVETAHSLALQDIRIYFPEVFTLDNVPTFDSDMGRIGSLDMTADVVDASSTARGLVNILAQMFEGLKTFIKGLTLQAWLATERFDVASAGTPFTALDTTKSYVKLTGSTVAEIQGATAGGNGQHLLIENGTTVDLTISEENAGASAANRFSLPEGEDIVLSPKQSQGFIYDTGLSRWVVAGGSGTGSGGAGGGGSFRWTEVAGSPVIDVEYNVRSAFFMAGGGQDLFVRMKVPTNYKLGKPIKLKMKFYSPDSSGDALLLTQSTLIQPGDVVNDTTNQRTSTNTAVTLGAGTVDEQQLVTFDLTDTLGQINGVAVEPDDDIDIRLYRDPADTATSDLRVQIDGAEPTYT